MSKRHVGLMKKLAASIAAGTTLLASFVASATSAQADDVSQSTISSNAVSAKTACVPDKSTVRQCFPDPNFAELMSWFTNTKSDSILTSKAISKVTYIDTVFTDPNPHPSWELISAIKSIEGIQVFTSLTSIHFIGTQVSDLTPLRDLRKLTYLDLSDNRISNIDALQGLTGLTVLFIKNNQIRNILPLKTLLESMKPVARLDLDISYNPITDFSPIQGSACQSKISNIQFGVTPKKLAGNLRYDTASQVVSEAFPGKSSTVILASGDNYPDALSAAGLAGGLNAPVMLTDPATLSVQAKSQITRLKPSRVIIAGGTGAVSAQVERSVAGLVPANGVVRIAGSTRYDTAAKIYEQGASTFGVKWSDTAIVTTGGGFADALSISPYAYAKKSPIFLADSNSGLDAKTVADIKARGFNRVVVLGGTGAVPSKVESQVRSAGVRSVDRVQGATRYATSGAIAKYAVKDGTLGFSNPVFATGANFPDALVGSALAGSKKSVLVLTNPDKWDDSDVKATLNWMGQSKFSIKQAYLLGGILGGDICGSLGLPLSAA